jgi:aminomethyltransferase
VLFDVSHMGQATLSGNTAATVLETLVPGDIAGLKPARQRYTLLTNEAGGILDDLMVATLEPGKLFLVVNASRKALDFAHIAAALPAGVNLTPHPDRALLALQGPLAAALLGRLCPAAATLPFMGVASALVRGIPCMLSRSGYTGEDGFEISVAAERAVDLATLLADQPEVVPAGLGARDSLRLEAGLCLYGNDIDELTSPVEAGLTWVIGKRRKQAWDFPGGAAIRDQLDNGAPRLRVGIRPEGRAPARAGTTIAYDGTEAGFITSGGFGPSLNAPIAMGYVRRDLSADGTKLSLLVRGKALPATVAPMPFVPHRYAR